MWILVAGVARRGQMTRVQAAGHCKSVQAVRGVWWTATLE
jgi:uncharacterized lipoprotein YddW (UPF0748 family)